MTKPEPEPEVVEEVVVETNMTTIEPAEEPEPDPEVVEEVVVDINMTTMDPASETVVEPEPEVVEEVVSEANMTTTEPVEEPASEPEVVAGEEEIMVDEANTTTMEPAEESEIMTEVEEKIEEVVEKVVSENNMTTKEPVEEPTSEAVAESEVESEVESDQMKKKEDKKEMVDAGPSSRPSPNVDEDKQIEVTNNSEERSITMPSEYDENNDENEVFKPKVDTETVLSTLNISTETVTRDTKTTPKIENDLTFTDQRQHEREIPFFVKYLLGFVLPMAAFVIYRHVPFTDISEGCKEFLWMKINIIQGLFIDSSEELKSFLSRHVPLSLQEFFHDCVKFIWTMINCTQGLLNLLNDSSEELKSTLSRHVTDSSEELKSILSRNVPLSLQEYFRDCVQLLWTMINNARGPLNDSPQNFENARPPLQKFFYNVKQSLQTVIKQNN